MSGRTFFSSEFCPEDIIHGGTVFTPISEGVFEFALPVCCSGCIERAACLKSMKMRLLVIAGGKYGWLFSLELLSLVIANIPLANGQQGSQSKTCTDGQLSLTWQLRDH